jgi:hypothetical protein
VWNDALKRQEHFTELANHQKEHKTPQELYNTDKNTEVVDVVLSYRGDAIVQLIGWCQSDKQVECKTWRGVDQIQNLPLVNRNVRFLLDGGKDVENHFLYKTENNRRTQNNYIV